MKHFKSCSFVVMHSFMLIEMANFFHPRFLTQSWAFLLDALRTLHRRECGSCQADFRGSSPLLHVAAFPIPPMFLALFLGAHRLATRFA